MSLGSGAASPVAGRLFALGNGKDPKNGVAHNLRHLPALGLGKNGSGRAVEVGIEGRQEIRRGERISQCRGIPEVAVPDDRGPTLAPPPLDGPIQDPPADQRPVERVEGITSDLVLDLTYPFIASASGRVIQRSTAMTSLEKPSGALVAHEFMHLVE